jgi:Concanavalin A-like lectin/glucanases superfamily
VPKGAEGFVIASPASAVVDRGTEFAVNVDSDGRSRVFVFEGLAEAALLDAEGSPKVTRIVERSQSFELDPTTGRIDESDATPDGFVRAPDLAAPALALGASYADAVLASRPVGFWRFESSGGGTIPNEVPGGPPLRSHGAVATSAGAGGNGCAVFRAGEPDQFLFTDGLWELARSPGHAVELWFMPEVIGDATLVGLYPPKDHLARWKRGRFVHTLLLELTAYERGSLFKPASIRFLHRWPLDTRIGNNLVSERLYIPGRWHHVVAQKNGDRLELFLDGELERVMPLKPDHPTLSCRLVVGRRTPDPLEPEDARPFVGRIDELAIYDRPLGIEEIRNHHGLAATEGSPLAIRAGR